ncbi:MAG TPA: hypothetical protein VHM70_05220 [Polyangiaceae bacterium]|jgi:hypothetical protein|nr:hypothetical protein [Polyangiaceae bacterium]
MRFLKNLMLVVLAILGLAIALFIYASRLDRERLGAAANPCESACIQDSGGLPDCRKHCSDHPNTYGPAALPSQR